MWKRPWVGEQLYQSFSNVDISSQTMLVNRLPDADPGVVPVLATQGRVMTQNQLKAYLQYLGENPESITPTLKTALVSVAADPNYAYGYLIKAFLQDH